jgi:hypothetical protein
MLSAAFLFLVLWTINLGTAFGAGLYEASIMLPLWFPQPHGLRPGINSKLMREADAGRRFWGMVTTLPLTLLTLVNCYFAMQASGTCRNCWLAAVAVVALERAATFTFFIPVALKFMNSETPATPADQALAETWIRLNHGRNLLVLIGWMGALHVFGTCAQMPSAHPQ